MEYTATVSKDGRYRYKLGRMWDSGLPSVTWIMLNPSTADAKTDDPTVRKCVGFSRNWGFGGITIVNLYALRATKPEELGRAEDPVGFFNDGHVATAVREATGPIVVAWGSHPNAPRVRSRVNTVINLPELASRQLDCIGTNRDRNPCHPLMLAYSTNRIPWRLPHD